ncbi:MAG: DUF885 domain-containing protein [Pseudomonadota bacterium]
MKRNALLAAAASVLLLAGAGGVGPGTAHGASPATATAGAEAGLAALVADYEAWNAGENPVSAGANGDLDALARLPDYSLAADKDRRALLAGFRDRLRAVPASVLSDDSRLNRAFLERLIDDQIAAIDLDVGRLPFSSDNSLDGFIGYLALTAPMTSKAEGEAWLQRLAASGDYYDQNIDNARRGLRTGWVQPRPISVIVAEQARKAAAAPVGTDAAVTALDRLPATLPAPERAALKARAAELVKTVLRPAQARYAAFMETEYLPASRQSLGASAMPGGKAYYAWLARRYTTTDLTPDQIHEIGLKEVARIRAEMDAVRAEAGFTGTHAEFLAFLRSDPRFFVTTRQALLEKASEIAKRIDDQLPRFFGTLPRLPYGVREVPREIEVGYTTGRYFPGSPAMGVAGGYMVNTSALDQRGLYELPALTLHEAVPGHHLQIALGQELEGVPAFRRDADMTVFVEGWGLYAERLGIEMGIYRTPYERFGRLSYEMWRACRLVADTGIHWKGWSRERARACFIENSALSPLNIEVELDRYISWPGQALAYKIGERKLVELRARAEAALGERFDVRRFHDAVLLAGPLPLDLLETRIDRWIAAEKAKG